MVKSINLMEMIGKDTLTLSLDLDNTAKDFTGAMRNFVAISSGFSVEETAQHLPDPITYDLDPWAWEHTVFEGFVDAFKAAEASGSLYADMVPHKGVAEAVNQIQEAGHKIHVITARSAAFEEETLVSLQRVGITPDALDFSNDKHLFHTGNGGVIDCYLDDSPSHLEKFAKMNLPAVAFHNTYNVHSTATARIYDWVEAPALFGL